MPVLPPSAAVVGMAEVLSVSSPWVLHFLVQVAVPLAHHGSASVATVAVRASC